MPAPRMPGLRAIQTRPARTQPDNPTLIDLDAERAAAEAWAADQAEKAGLRISRVELPHDPTPRQQLFLDLNDKEAFYGGAAGGGKSDALLMDMVKYRDVPGYSALIIRRTFKELIKADAIMDRAHQWFRNTAARWNAEKRNYTFPGPRGATLEFGHFEHISDKWQYQSAAYQAIAFDEVTEFQEEQYTFLFSRLRRLKGSDIPTRMRAASNPGGVGHEWVKARFIPDDWTPEMALQMRVYWKESQDEEGRPTRRPFVPARIQDNPHLDQEDYIGSLDELDSVTRAQLLSGDWTIRPRGDILSMWDEQQHVIGWETHVKPLLGVPHIPKHWLLSVYEDIGQTEGHPAVTTWIAKAALNAPPQILPGSLFIYRGRCIFNQTVRQMAEDTKAKMAAHQEIERVRAWKMSHEAKSERIEYQREQKIPFVSWTPGKTRGIAQMRRYHEIVKERITSEGKVVPVMHPFKPGVVGTPRIFYCVADDELNYAKTDAGLARHRAEAPAYKWKVNSDGTTPAVAIPHDLFNDAMDTERMACADYGPPMALPTAKEIFEARLAEEVLAPEPEQADQAVLSRIIWADEFEKEQTQKKPPQVPGRAIVSVPRGVRIRFR